MEKIKQIFLSSLVIVMSLGYVVFQPQETEVVLGQSPAENPLQKQVPTSEEKETDTSLALLIPPKDVSTSTPETTTPTNPLAASPKSQVPAPTAPSLVVPPQPASKPVAYTPPTPKPVIPPPTPKAQTPPVSLPKGLYVDGVYTSSPFNAYYGTVQTKTTVLKGEIVSVVFLQYPDNRSTSRKINKRAMPKLQKEVIKSQNAKVSGVSGATYTSKAFRKAMKEVVTQAAS